MALQPCSDCGREISTEAAICPTCGKPAPTGARQEVVRDRISILLLIPFCLAILAAISLLIWWSQKQERLDHERWLRDNPQQETRRP
jgi:hypothetical protein